MPIYEYACQACAHRFDMLRPLSLSGEPASCPACQSPAARRPSAFACFSKDTSGSSAPVAGTAGACSGCSATSCGTCGH